MDVVVPKLGLTISEAEIGAWLHEVGDEVAAGDPLVEIRADKADVELEAPTSGLLASVFAAEGDIVPVGATIAVINSPRDHPADADRGPAARPSPEPSTRHARLAVDASPPASGTATGVRRPASSPRARARAAARGIALATVRGTGPGGRIVERDVNRMSPQAAAVPGRAETDRPRSLSSAASPLDRSELEAVTWGVRDIRVEIEALDLDAADWTAALVCAAAQAARSTGFASSTGGPLTVRVEAGVGNPRVTVQAADHLTRAAVRARLAAAGLDDIADLVVVDLRGTGLHDGVLPETPMMPTVVVGTPRAAVGALRSGRSWTIGVEAVVTVRAHPVASAAVDRTAAFLDAFSRHIDPPTSSG